MADVDNMKATVVTDSKSLEESIATTTSLRDKRAMVGICTIRRIPETENISLQWCRGKTQVADVLTKAGVNTDKLRNMLAKGELQELLQWDDAANFLILR